jgi:5'-nucleotidase
MRVGSCVLTLVIIMSPVAICWELSLLHVNDIHARMEETNKYSSKCRVKDKVKGKCYGGLARMYSAVKDIRKREDNVLWLNAGDFYQVCDKNIGRKINVFVCRARCGIHSSSGIWFLISTTC